MGRNPTLFRLDSLTDKCLYGQALVYAAPEASPDTYQKG